MGTGEARYPIQIPVESNAAEQVSPLEALKRGIDGAQSAIKSYGSALRAIKGDSEEAKSIRQQLKDKIDAEKTALSRNTMEMLKAGTTYDKLTQSTKKFELETKKSADALKDSHAKLGKSIDAIGGPVADLKGKMSGLSDIFEGATSAEAGLALGAVAAVAGVAALAGGVVYLGAKLFEFITTSGNMLRTQQLTREAFTGNAEDALALGSQIEALAKKVPATRAELNQLGNDLVQDGLKGQVLVDALNTVGQATSAMNATAGNKLKELLERGKLTQRFSLGQFETQGTGLQFQDVAKALAANTKTSVQEASMALIQGQVTLGEGAKALRDAVESRFGKVNLAKMLDLDVLKKKFSDTFDALTKDVNLDPLLNGFKDLMSLFDTSTETGTDLKELITWFGSGVADEMGKGVPVIKGMVESLVGYALDLQLDYLDLKIQFLDTFGDDVTDKIDGFQVGVVAVQTAVNGMTGDLRAALAVSKELYDLGKKLGKEVGGANTSAQGQGGWGQVTKNAVVSTATFGLAAPAHAQGGVVASPAPGEYLASVHPGERILPEDLSRQIDAIARGQLGGPSGGQASGATGSLSMPAINVTVNLTGTSGSKDQDQGQDIKTKVKEGIVEALEIFARQRGLLVT